MTRRRLFFAIFGCLLAVVGAQILGTPRNAGPDEPAHIVRGAGLVRGELFGEQLAEWSASHAGVVLDPGGADIANADPDSDALRVFDVPRWLAQPSEACFAHQPQIPAKCAAEIESDGSGLLSTAAWYPIWGHLLPGLATVALSGSEALWLARFLHALVPVALIAATLARLIGSGRRVAASASLVAITPMVLFLVAVVNPSGIVAAGSIAVWVAADDAYRTGDASSWLLPAGVAALVLPRDDSLLWAALMLLVLTVVWRRSPLALWRAAPVGTRVVVVAITVVGALWSVLSGGDLVPVDRPATGIELAELVVQRTGRHVREAVGVLGWLDTQIPESAFALWCFAAGVVAMIALATNHSRRVAGSAVALGLFVVAGWVITIVQGRTAGLFWQGRYALPMLIGFVLVAALSPGADRQFGRLAVAAPAVVAVVVWNLAFFQELRRWGVGETGTIRPWAWDTWGSPLPVLLLMAVHVAASAGLCWLALSSATYPPVNQPARRRVSNLAELTDRSTSALVDGRG
jgi:hypothetical protein